jgi:hypothetical protein
MGFPKKPSGARGNQESPPKDTLQNQCPYAPTYPAFRLTHWGARGATWIRGEGPE